MKGNLKCKICGCVSEYFDTVNFNKNCNEFDGFYLENSEESVDYHKCTNCHFIFTNYFDNFSKEDFLERIYNNDYIKVDPLFEIIRPEINSNFLSSILEKSLKLKKVLKY
jgi:hypothetical protein